MMAEPSASADARAASPLLTIQESHPAPARALVSLTALWFGLVGGPAAWSVQTIANLATASHTCYPDLFPRALPTMNGMRAALVTLSILVVLACLAAAIVSARSWRHTRHEHQTRSGTAGRSGRASALLEAGEGRTRFLALAGFMTSITFVFLCVAQIAAMLTVAPCGR